MATVIPPPSKKQRRLAQAPRDADVIPEDLPSVLVKFQASDTGEFIGGNVRVPGGSSEKFLEELLNRFSENSDDPVPYTFSVIKKTTDKNNKEIEELIDLKDNLYTAILKPGHKTTEDLLTLVYTPRAVFKVRSVNRSSAAINGHGSTILAAQFAPNTSSRLVTGSGDSTARIWDCDTSTPLATLTGHTDWVLCVSWSPDGETIATGSMDGTVRLWNGKDGKPIGDALRGHSKFISSLSWEPYHSVKEGEKSRLASSSKDSTIKIWDVVSRNQIFTLSGHTSTVSCVKWGGMNTIFSTSHDKTIKIWSAKDGRCLQTLKAHAHWVNHISLSTDYALRIGPFDHTGTKPKTPREAHELAKKNFEKLATIGGKIVEKAVTASDDFTMYLWEPYKSSKPVCRMVGHQKLVNHVIFSPDGRYIASASFDNSIKLWDGRDGKFLSTFRGHVASVYQCSWSSDSRLLVSCSKDTTLKVWDVRTRKLSIDLPGHQDEVYAVDWSVDGNKVASGGKDKQVRLWAS